MCGIAGIVNTDGRIVERDEIVRLTDLIAHRGPDGDGYWFNAERNIALGHRRLAIIDPGPTGDQPMASADGRHIIVYNGEIYNFLELRRELEARGITFRSQSDTEVILAAWQVWGEEMLLRFNGMWALAIYDTTTRELFLARDRFGIKPLLYAATPSRFVFASEQRALLRSGLVAVRSTLPWRGARCSTPSASKGASARSIEKYGGCPPDTGCGCARGASSFAAGGARSIICRKFRTQSRIASRALANCSAMRSRCGCAATFRSEHVSPAASTRPR